MIWAFFHSDRMSGRIATIPAHSASRAAPVMSSRSLRVMSLCPCPTCTLRPVSFPGSVWLGLGSSILHRFTLRTMLRLTAEGFKRFRYEGWNLQPRRRRARPDPWQSVEVRRSQVRRFQSLEEPGGHSFGRRGRRPSRSGVRIRLCPFGCHPPGRKHEIPIPVSRFPARGATATTWRAGAVADAAAPQVVAPRLPGRRGRRPSRALLHSFAPIRLPSSGPGWRVPDSIADPRTPPRTTASGAGGQSRGGRRRRLR
jgi:hypothetical protein